MSHRDQDGDLLLTLRFNRESHWIRVELVVGHCLINSLYAPMAGRPLHESFPMQFLSRANWTWLHSLAYLDTQETFATGQLIIDYCSEQVDAMPGVSALAVSWVHLNFQYQSGIAWGTTWVLKGMVTRRLFTTDMLRKILDLDEICGWGQSWECNQIKSIWLQRINYVRNHLQLIEVKKALGDALYADFFFRLETGAAFWFLIWIMRFGKTFIVRMQNRKATEWLGFYPIQSGMSIKYKMGRFRKNHDIVYSRQFSARQIMHLGRVLIFNSQWKPTLGEWKTSPAIPKGSA